MLFDDFALICTYLVIDVLSQVQIKFFLEFPDVDLLWTTNYTCVNCLLQLVTAVILSQCHVLAPELAPLLSGQRNNMPGLVEVDANPGESATKTNHWT